MKKSEGEKVRERFLQIKANQVDDHLMHRRLTPKEEAELDALKQKLSEPVLDEAEFKIFKDVVKQYGGKILSLPTEEPEKEKLSPSKKITKIVLTKDLVYEYSGRAYLTFPIGSQGHIVHKWEDVPWISKEEIDNAKEVCKSFDLVPVYCEYKLICLKRKDFKIEGERACA